VGVIERLQRGERVAYVSDAGTPAVSDPGARLVAAVRSAALGVMPLPGASSVTTALSAAGMKVTGVSGESGFVFAGFLPSKAGERDQAVAALLSESKSVVIMEAPHRIEALAQAFTPLGSRLVTICRELTKQFEEIATVAADQLASWLAAGAQRTRGEFVLVLHPMPTAAPKEDGQRVLQLLLAELPLKTAVKLAAEITGAPRNDLYDAALKLKNNESER
jgi:16S rRNA (cytidine1402-2'-O)-methyltransferase